MERQVFCIKFSGSVFCILKLSNTLLCFSPFKCYSGSPKSLLFTFFFLFISKRNSNSAGPFVVPDHLRQDVEEFEALYEQHSNEYVVRNKKLWDINPKQKCSTLYE